MSNNCPKKLKINKLIIRKKYLPSQTEEDNLIINQNSRRERRILTTLSVPLAQVKGIIIFINTEGHIVYILTGNNENQILINRDGQKISSNYEQII